MEKRENIEKHLSVSIFKVSMIIAAGALIALLALVTILNRYSYALKNFGFAQGDIGKAMFEFADLHSSLRAAIGYDNEDAIKKMVAQHTEQKELFDEYFTQVENTIVSDDGRETYDAIKSELDAYWELDAKILELGATTDRELCVQAQNLALNELAGAYDSIYTKLDQLLTVKVDEGNSLAKALTITGVILSAAIVIIIIMAMIFASKVSKKICRRRSFISVPCCKHGR